MSYLRKQSHLRYKDNSASSNFDEGVFQQRQPSPIRQKTNSDKRKIRHDDKKRRGGKRGRGGGGKSSGKRVADEESYRKHGRVDSEDGNLRTSITECSTDQNNADNTPSAFTVYDVCSEDQCFNETTHGRSKQRSTRKKVTFSDEKNYRRKDSRHGNGKDSAERSFPRYRDFHDSSDDDDCKHQASQHARKAKRTKKSPTHRRNRHTIAVSTETMRALDEVANRRSCKSKQLVKTYNDSNGESHESEESESDSGRLHTFLRWTSKKYERDERSDIYVIPKRTQFSNLTTKELDYISLCVRTEAVLKRPLPLASNRTVYKYWLKEYGIALTGLLLTDSSDIETSEEDEDEPHCNEEGKVQCYNQQQMSLPEGIINNPSRVPMDTTQIVLVKDDINSISTQPKRQCLDTKSTSKDTTRLSLQTINNISISPAANIGNIKEAVNVNNTSNEMNIVSTFLKSATTFFDNTFGSVQKIETKITCPICEKPVSSTDGKANNDRPVTCNQETQTFESLLEVKLLETRNKERTPSSSSFIADNDENKTAYKLASLIADNLLKRQSTGSINIANKVRITAAKQNIKKHILAKTQNKFDHQEMDLSSEQVEAKFGDQSLPTPRPPSRINDSRAINRVYIRRVILPTEEKQTMTELDSLPIPLNSDVPSVNNVTGVVTESTTESDAFENISNKANGVTEQNIECEETGLSPKLLQTADNSTQLHEDKIIISKDLVGNIPETNGDGSRMVVNEITSEKAFTPKVADVAAGICRKSSRPVETHEDDIIITSEEVSNETPSLIGNTSIQETTQTPTANVPHVTTMNTAPTIFPGEHLLSSSDNFQSKLMEEIESKPKRLIDSLPPPVFSRKGFLGSYINQTSSSRNDLPSVNSHAEVVTPSTLVPHNPFRRGLITPIETPEFQPSPQRRNTLAPQTNDSALAVGKLPPRRGILTPMSAGSVPAITTTLPMTKKGKLGLQRTAAIDDYDISTASASSRLCQLAPLSVSKSATGEMPAKSKGKKKKKKDKKNKKTKGEPKETLNIPERHTAPGIYPAYLSKEEFMAREMIESRSIDSRMISALNRQTNMLSSSHRDRGVTMGVKDDDEDLYYQTDEDEYPNEVELQHGGFGYNMPVRQGYGLPSMYEQRKAYSHMDHHGSYRHVQNQPYADRRTHAGSRR